MAAYLQNVGFVNVEKYNSDRASLGLGKATKRAEGFWVASPIEGYWAILQGPENSAMLTVCTGKFARQIAKSYGVSLDFRKPLVKFMDGHE